tara:strand:- start:141 stop:335 length:195 start_codon:yes stop_codon:yes gene_type:complete
MKKCKLFNAPRSNIPDALEKIADKIDKIGGKSFLVGGLGLFSKSVLSFNWMELYLLWSKRLNGL